MNFCTDQNCERDRFPHAKHTTLYALLDEHEVYTHCCQDPIQSFPTHCCDCGVRLTGSHRHLKACIHNWPNVRWDEMTDEQLARARVR